MKELKKTNKGQEMDAQELKLKMQGTHIIDQQWSEAKNLIKNMADVHSLSLIMAEHIKKSNLSDKDKTVSIYFLGILFKKMSFEINCEIDDEEMLEKGEQYGS